MSEQLYRILKVGEVRRKGDCKANSGVLEPVSNFGTVVEDYHVDVLRPVDPVPVNPWIKGSERLPRREDATENGYVWVYREDMDYPQVLGRGSVTPSHFWRSIDQTPPPAEPTIEDLWEKVLRHIEQHTFHSNVLPKLAAEIRAKQESEGRDE